jgi:hypothetical protein
MSCSWAPPGFVGGRESRLNSVSGLGLKNFFSFLYFFSLNFVKIYGSEIFLQNYTSSAVGDGGRDLPSCLTTLGARRYCSACYRRGSRR